MFLESLDNLVLLFNFHHGLFYKIYWAFFSCLMRKSFEYAVFIAVYKVHQQHLCVVWGDFGMIVITFLNICVILKSFAGFTCLVWE